MHITLERRVDAVELEQFYSILRNFNAQQRGISKLPPELRTICLLLRDDVGTVFGGLDGDTNWGWLFVSNLVVAEPYRGGGFGSQLMKLAETEALRRGCHSAYLDTFEFQALGFYQKLGYEVFGTLDDYPSGFKRFFLQKKLNGDR